MKSTRLSTNVHNIIKYISVVLSIFTLLFCAYMHRNTKTIIQSGDVFHWKTGWTTNGDLIESLPYSVYVYKGNSLSITNTLPSDISDGDFLMFPSQYSRNDIYINGELVYSYPVWQPTYPCTKLYPNEFLVRTCNPLIYTNCYYYFYVNHSSHFYSLV